MLTATRKLPAPDRRRTCSNCNHVGHLSPTCEREEGVIDKIGIEVEGFWSDLHAIQRTVSEKGWPAGNSDGSLMARDGGCDECNGLHECSCNYCQDCSDDDCPSEHECVCNLCECASDCACRATSSRDRSLPAASAWEFQTRPGTLGEQISALQTLYPDFTNSSAGMHVHLSFREGGHGAAMALANAKFFAFWQERWQAWGKRNGVKGQFWKRLKGENKYSSLNTMQDWGAGVTNLTQTNDRRKQINFQAWNEHQTVEFRLLPMFRDAKIAISAVCELVSLVEDWFLMPESLIKIESKPLTAELPKSVHESYALDATMDTLVKRDMIKVVHVLSKSELDGAVHVPRILVESKMKAITDKALGR